MRQTILCRWCNQAIKNAGKEAEKYQYGQTSKVVVRGPDLFHSHCWMVAEQKMEEKTKVKERQSV